MFAIFMDKRGNSTLDAWKAKLAAETYLRRREGNLFGDMVDAAGVCVWRVCLLRLLPHL
jgi:hypothetical protein